MSSAQNDTFSPHNLAVLGGLLFFALFLGEVVFSRDSGDSMDSMSVGTMDDVSMRLRAVVTLDDILANASSGAAGAADKSPKELYAGGCLACHASGVAGAPKVGAAADWEYRVVDGLDTLTSSAIKGRGAMPPNGGSAYSPEQMRAVIEYMLAESGM